MDVDLLASAGFVREWNFRAPSGFTAVGLRRDNSAHSINGVLFRVPAADAFDSREAGYERLPIRPPDLRILSPAADDDATRHAAAALAGGRARFWVYVPLACESASENHPICQTYVDVCVVGCLERGGAELARRWVQTTGGWSEFWLNDAPLSRRPWLHRPRHAEIDAILQAEQARTRFDERRHPEDFSGRWSGAFTNMQWGVPPRNPHFTGRRATLERIASGLNAPGERDSAAGQQGVTTLELVGMGGVGKTQLAVEFCHRHYAAAKPEAAGGASSSGYSVVIWLRAETAEVLAADLRALAADCGIGGVQGLRNEEVVAEVRSRLHRTRGAWLLVFDNVASRELLEAHLPRGCHGAGHVLVTTRELVERSSPLLLDCFAPDESLELLRRAGGDALDIDEPLKGGGGSAGAAVAEKLGHLPLALAIAAAYMRACDVPCSAYLRKLSSTRAAPRLDGAGASYATGVADSSLSLAQVDRDAAASAAAGGSALVVAPRRVLDVLAFAAPEAISRELVAEAVRAILLEAAAAGRRCRRRRRAAGRRVGGARAGRRAAGRRRRRRRPRGRPRPRPLASPRRRRRRRRRRHCRRRARRRLASRPGVRGEWRRAAHGRRAPAAAAAAGGPPPAVVGGGGRQRRRGGVSRGRVRRGGRRRRMDEAQGLLAPRGPQATGVNPQAALRTAASVARAARRRACRRRLLLGARAIMGLRCCGHDDVECCGGRRRPRPCPRCTHARTAERVAEARGGSGEGGGEAGGGGGGGGVGGGAAAARLRFAHRGCSLRLYGAISIR